MVMNHYKLRLKSPQSHIFELELTINQPNSDGQVVYLPAWIRGSYLVRDYARHIISLQAFCASQQIKAEKIDKHSWKIEPTKAPIRIVYTIYAWELSVRSAHFDTTHAYFNGTALFLGVHGQELDSCHLDIVRPEEMKCTAGWKVAIAMTPLKVDDDGFGVYHADNYEDFIDCPAEIGLFSVGSFTVEGCNHRFVTSGTKWFDQKQICGHLELICKKQVDLFGELPARDYLFLLRVVGEGYGGLEHKNSTSLIFSRTELPGRRDKKISTGYRRLLALCSHEYFHLWNVKRITPKAFLEHDTSQEVYTRQLWIFEGITSYYDELMLLRSGIIDRNDYFEMLAETVTRVMRGSGRHKQTLEESSFDAWTKFYKQDENAPNAIVSYYAKGALFALVLDLTIRLQTKGELSLDHVMRAMWERYGKNALGVPEDGFERLVLEVTSLNLKQLFEQGIRSTLDLPLAETLEEYGVQLQLVPAHTQDDKGGITLQATKDREAPLVLGAKFIDSSGVIRVQQVFDDSAAQVAGLSSGDEIIAVDGLRMNAKQIESYIADQDLGSIIEIHLFRRDELMVITLEPQTAPSDTCLFYLPDKLDQEKQKRLTNWLQDNAR
jgi:predicted metalloprotease with PDZ domain